MRRRTVAVAGGWLVAAVAATALGVAGIDSLGAGLLGGGGAAGERPLTSAEVDRLLAAETAAPSVSPSAAPSPPSGAAVRSLSTGGGVVHASCAGGLVSLTSWSPAQGYRVDDAERGPAAEVRVKFKRGKDELRVFVTCVGGVPTARSVAHG
ncbi:hypothetical protein F4553_007671 [Allocatelliglobosispora scoriae]|uniref:Septum formation initiator n=1 Tax=Allocatelliglobosispora scoriae TaxID=643052 RepID=A0A841BYL1_9ACTN|nr:hypothetical protein [Allocatelliglobosispora scoriae]MBB5874237.1 hypothetical protein [Allocatelliglobosispora scoriae]